ncbi:MAG: response regulator [Bacteroidota bacterium]|nr:response regulator [Bacteroidota bacterium]
MITENMWINNTILVVEDEDVNFQLIKYCLKKTGANLKWAKNGKESLYLLNKYNDIDLVLMDIRMPLMDGIKATKKIRQNKMDLPVIMHSSFENDYHYDNEIETLFSDFVPKPFKREFLINTIAKYIENNKLKNKSA